MAKKIMQDMIVRKGKPRKRAEKKIIKKKTKSTPHIQPVVEKKVIDHEVKEHNYLDKYRQKTPKEKIKSSFPKFKLIYKLAIALFFIFAFVFVLKSFSWVTLMVTPRQDFINLDTSLEAYVGPISDKQNIYFELMEVSEEGEKLAKSTGLKDLERKASGQIIVYNAYSSAPQTLVRRTRFSTPDGKIYRIDNQVVVPGAKIVNGGIVPSSIEVTVYADKYGEEYNIGLSDFNIPGFKGDARYEKFYARSSTDMKGGFVGTLNVVTGDNISSTREELRAEIKDALIKKTEMSIPNGFLYYKDLTMLDFVSSGDNPNAGDEVENFTLKEKGVMKAFLIREADLSDTLVSKYIEDDAPVRILNLEDLAVTLTERNKDNNKIIFNVNGKGHFIWNINEVNLKKDFLERGKNKAELFFKNYPIEKAEITFHPSWWRISPKDDSRIKYEEILKN